MTSRERVLTAIARKPADRVPMDFGGTLMSVCLPEFLEEMRRTLGYALPEDRDADGTWVDERIQRYLNVDMRLVPGAIPRAILKEIDPDAYRLRLQEQPYIPMASRTIITHAVRTEFPLRGWSYEDIRDGYAEKAPAPPPDSHIDWYIATAKKYRADGYATTFWVSSGIFEMACWLRGYDDICTDLLLEPDTARLLFERIMEARLRWVDAIVPPLQEYIDIFCFGDDLAMQTGPFMSPALYRELIMPYQSQIYARMKRLAPNSHIFHHSCGSVYRLIPLLVEMGVTVLNPTQVSAFEMEPERLRGCAEICFHGGIDLQHLLPFGTPDEVRREAERIMGILSPGYLCAPCHSLPEDVPVENILALFSADRRQAKNNLLPM